MRRGANAGSNSGVAPNIPAAAARGQSIEVRTASDPPSPRLRRGRRITSGPLRQGYGLNPMRGLGGGGGPSISSRMASNTTLKWASYLFSSAISFRARSAFDISISRSPTNARTMAMLTRDRPTARPLPARALPSIQRRPRTSYSPALHAGCAERWRAWLHPVR
jgi:hypothetical protein